MDSSMPLEVPRLHSFTGQEFNSWKRKILFGLQYINVYYTVLTDFANTIEDVNESQWGKDDMYCKSYLLNCLSDRLADTYGKYETAKEIWDNLEAQFQKQEDLSKTHLVDKFEDFKFEADKEILPQVTDLENLRSKLANEGIKICDRFLVGAIIYRLPTTWHDFKTEMYRNKVQVELTDLRRFIRIEDENRARSNLEIVRQQQSAANFVTNPKKPPKPAKTPKPESAKLEATQPSFKRKKGKCRNCNKWGHHIAECRQPKQGNHNKSQKETHMVSDTAPTDIIAMVNKRKASDSTSE